MEFKYKHEVSDVADCPPALCSQGDRDAFRFVHSDLKDDRNFKPPGIIKPSRLDKDKKTKPANEVCDLCALSMYATEAQLRAAFGDLKSRYPKITSTLGTHYASGRISEEHGVMDPPGTDGHFNLYEAAGTDCSVIFFMVGAL